MLLTFSCYKNIKLFQIDVNNAILSGLNYYGGSLPRKLSRFKILNFPIIYLIEKAQHGLEQAPKALYERLGKFFT